MRQFLISISAKVVLLLSQFVVCLTVSFVKKYFGLTLMKFLDKG